MDDSGDYTFCLVAIYHRGYLQINNCLTIEFQKDGIIIMPWVTKHFKVELWEMVANGVQWKNMFSASKEYVA